MEISRPFVFPGEGAVLFGAEITPKASILEGKYFDWSKGMRTLPMSPEEQDRMEQHIRDQLAATGMPPQHMDPTVVSIIARFTHETRKALGPGGYTQAYQVMDWYLKTIES
jgi:hypothetical protein